MSRKDRDNVEVNENEAVDSELVVAEKKAKLEAKRLERAEAKARVKDFLKTLEGEEYTQIKADVMLFVGKGRTRVAGEKAVSVNSLIKQHLIDNGSITEMDVFLQYKIGRPEMKIKERLFIKNAPTPEERIWITFNEANESYELVGVGENAPENWDGFLPADLIQL